MIMRVLLTFLFWVFSLGIPAWGQPLNIMTEDYPPYDFPSADGKTVVGMSADIVRELMSRAGLDYTISIYPWERALVMTETQPGNGAFSVMRSPEREPKFKWVGPIVVDNLAVYGLEGTKIVLNSLDDVKKYTIGTYLGSVTNEYLESRGIRPDKAPQDSLNMEKLKLGRIDLWVASYRAGPYVARKSGVKLTRLYLFDKTFEMRMYLACNKAVPDTEIDRLNQIVQQMTVDGTMERLIGKY